MILFLPLAGAAGRRFSTVALSLAGVAAVLAYLAWRLASSRGDDEVLAALARSGARAEYRREASRLEIDLSAPTATDEALPVVARISRLESLTLRGGAITDASLEKLRSLDERRTFHSLGLIDTRVTEAGIAALAPLPIRSLVLRGNAIAPAGLARLRSLLSLRHLTLYDDRLEDGDLVRLEDCDQLESLGLFAKRLTGDGVARLAKSLPRCEIRRHE